MTNYYIERDGEHGVRLVATTVGPVEREIGFARVRPRELPYGRVSTVRYAEITELVVEPEHRRGGVGRKLVELALSWAGQQGFEAVAVESTARPDKPGPPFYAALGFTPRSTVWDIPLTGENHEG